MSEQQQLEAAIAALEAQRALLGDAVVELAAAPLRAKLQALQAPAAEAAQQLKQVTVMFVDTVGSTAMAQRLDPEDIHTILDGTLEAFTAIVRRHGGRVMQYTGDGLLAAFGADEAREDDPENAVRAGLAVIAEARQRAQWVQGAHGVTGFNVRVGLDTGPVLLGGGVDAEGSIRGSVVNMAARMEQTAPPGALRIHHDTWRHVRGLFRVTEEPPLTVKGHAEPVTSYLVQGALPRGFRVASRGIEGVRTRMVAREVELETLQDAFVQLFERPTLAVVTVVADAGMGKSRLLYEFEQWAHGREQQASWLRGRAEPQTQNQPFGLLRNILAWQLQIAEDDDAATARRKLTDGLAPLFPEDGEAQAHLIGQMIGLDFADSPHVKGIRDDAQQIRNRAFHAAAQSLRHLGARTGRPPVLLVDDLHWADDASLDFLVYLAQVERDQPGLVIGLARESLFERRADWALQSATHTRIDLPPLDARASRELANQLLQRLDTVPAQLRDLLIDGAAGNPFYMEELVRMLIDDGAIDTRGERWRVVPDRLQAAHVPPTLTGVLQARLDSLPPAEKRALQQAAVIGFVFWEHALAALEGEATAALPALVERGLLVPRPQASFQGQNEYAFKHQILHQVTYDSVLRRTRRDLHARIAGWLAPQGGDRATETLGMAAFHYERAGDAANAAEFFTRAAEDAARRYANDAVRDFVERGLALAREDDLPLRWRLLALRERIRGGVADRKSHEADLDALAALAEALDDDTRRCLVAVRRANTLASHGRIPEAETVVRAGLALARPFRATPETVSLHYALGNVLARQGRYAESRQVVQDGLALARERGHPTEISRGLNALGLQAMDQGDLMQAAEWFEQSLALLREAGDVGGQGLRLSNLGSVYPRLGDYARGRRCLEEGLQIARATGDRSTEAVLLLNVASAAHLQGDDTGALAYARAAHERAVATGQRDLEAFARMVAGHAELGLGRFDAARAAYGEARTMLEQWRMRRENILEPVSGLARVALAQGRVDEALAHVELLMAHVAAGGSFDGTEEPLLLPLTCFQVLEAAGDPRAGEVLDAAMAELQAQADRISDPAARRGLLDNVPHHREIVAAWQRRKAGAALA